MWDVFISHAWEDKEDVARPLAEALRQKGLRVWYDEFTLTLGDSLRRSIDRGLAQSRYGVVILSPSFFAKEWPQKELDGLAAREVGSRKIILPVWHNVTWEDVKRFSPTLADKLAVSTAKSLDAVIEEILRALGVLSPPVRPTPAKPRWSMNWGKVGAIAGVIAVVIALGAWLVPNARDFISAWLSGTPIAVVTPKSPSDTSTSTNTPTSAPNDTIAYYPFEVISKYDTQCWRVRTTPDGVPLGTEVKPAFGKGREGSGALEFSFTLPLAQGGVGGAQIDQMGEGPNCAKSVPMIPSTGQVELWVYLDAGASEGEGVTLQAEPFFAPINVIPAWLYGPAVDLKPNQWNRVCWDRSNSPSGVGFGGDDWSGQLQAFGLEIKFADPAPTTPYIGIVYIDDVRLIGNAEGEACP